MKKRQWELKKGYDSYMNELTFPSQKKAWEKDYKGAVADPTPEKGIRKKAFINERDYKQSRLIGKSRRDGYNPWGTKLEFEKERKKVRGLKETPISDLKDHLESKKKAIVQRLSKENREKYLNKIKEQGQREYEKFLKSTDNQFRKASGVAYDYGKGPQRLLENSKVDPSKLPAIVIPESPKVEFTEKPKPTTTKMEKPQGKVVNEGKSATKNKGILAWAKKNPKTAIGGTLAITATGGGLLAYKKNKDKKKKIEGE